MGMTTWHVSITHTKTSRHRTDIWHSPLHVDKNLSQEDAVTKLRAEVQDLNTQYTSLKSMFMEKERQQQEAFNASIEKTGQNVSESNLISPRLRYYRDSRHPPYSLD
jgi:hypothetical protein